MRTHFRNCGNHFFWNSANYNIQNNNFYSAHNFGRQNHFGFGLNRGFIPFCGGVVNNFRNIMFGNSMNSWFGGMYGMGLNNQFGCRPNWFGLNLNTWFMPRFTNWFGMNNYFTPFNNVYGLNQYNYTNLFNQPLTQMDTFTSVQGNNTASDLTQNSSVQSAQSGAVENSLSEVSSNNTSVQGTQNNSSVKPPKTQLNTPKIEFVTDEEYNSLDKSIRDEMEYIAKDVLDKYLKTGEFKKQDLLIERVDAVITNVDISGKYSLSSGTDNDYRLDNGDVMRVSDGTIITMKFTHNNKEYTIKLKSNQVPIGGEAQAYLEKRDVKLSFVT